MDLANEKAIDAEYEAREALQEKIDSMVSDMWKSEGEVENVVTDTSDILTKVIMKCEQGAISNEE